MTCPSPIVHSMYADGALAADEALRLERHAATCSACRARIMALSGERDVLRAALHEVDDAAPIPSFAPPMTVRDLLVLVLGVGIVGALANQFWSAAVEAVPSGLLWLNPLQTGELIERGLRFITFIVYEGDTMLTTALNFTAVALGMALFAWIAFATVRRRAFAGVAASVLAIVIALPSIGHAFERRIATGTADAIVTVPAGETIDDTLFVAADTIAIDGNVNGDLLAFGRSITVRGNVTGNLITGGESIMVEGSVGGSIIGGGRGLSLARARVGGNLFGFGRDLDLDASAEVVGNALGFGETVGIDGRVGKDLLGFGNNVRIGGNVTGDVDGFAGKVTLLPSARVGGNVTAHVDSMDDLSIADGAVVGGTVDTQIVEREQRRNEYATVGYYFRQVVRLGAAFLSGFLLLWLFPALREVSLPTVGAVLRSGAIGFAAMVALPIAAVIVCFTIVGIPLAVLTFVLGAIGLYFAKTVLAQVIGRAVYRSPTAPPHFAATLLVGLVITIVAVELPFVGGIANFLLTIVGFGIIVTLLLARFSRESAPA